MPREPVTPADAAAVLFASDRTCCVCRERGKRVQLHHIDEDNENSRPDNLAALCFDCHDLTQVRGGFGRRLDAAQVRQYRDDWDERVRARRDAADRLAAAVMAGVPRVVQAGDTLQVVVSESVTVNETVGVSAGTSTAAGVSATRSSVTLKDYLKTLPALRQKAYAEAIPEWHSGVTARMVNATYRIIDVLQDVLAALAACYPAGHFDREDPKDYIAELIATRFRWHRYRHEPDGYGQDGTIVHTLVAGSVLADVERMVLEMVGSLTLDWSDRGGDAEGFNLARWETEWEKRESVDSRGLRTPADRTDQR